MTGAPPASTLHLPIGPWATVLDCLCAHFASISRDTWTARFSRGRVLDGCGRPLLPGAPYRAGLEVRYYRELDCEAPIPFAEAVRYADEHLVVADKPHFLPVAPTGRWVEQTLLTRLIARLGNDQLTPLHRIDRGTAGIVLFSANPVSRAAYHALFRERRITKTYEALAAPLPGRDFPLWYRSRLERGEPFFRMRETQGAPNSETCVTVLERGANAWRYALTPVTGRTHQLRVHLAALGAPILNDPYYPQLSAADADDYTRPLALLAKALEFRDPLSGEPRRFTSELNLGLLANATPKCRILDGAEADQSAAMMDRVEAGTGRPLAS